MRSTFTSYRRGQSSNSGSSRMNSTQHRFFVQQSPRKPREKMPTIYRHKFLDKPFFVDRQYNNFNQNPEVCLRLNSLAKAKKDIQVQKERQQMLIKTGLNSSDNPEWLTSTIKYYKKSNFCPPRKSQILDQKSFDVMNNSRSPFTSRRQENTYYKSMIKEQIELSNSLKNNSEFNKSNNFGMTSPSSQMDQKFRSTLNWSMRNQKEISPKVGSLNSRDYTIRKPTLKVNQQGSYVDTYSPWEKF